MNNKNNSKKSEMIKSLAGCNYVKYTYAFVIIAAVMMLPFLYFSKTLIWEVDGYLQWYPIMVKMRTFIADFVHGNGIHFWSWDTGLGADNIANYAFVLFDPFNYIVAFFSRQNADIAYTVIEVLKLYFAGFAMVSYLQYHNRSTKLCVIGAISYAFCGWAFLGLHHQFFLTQMILFPLFILAIDKIEDKKSPLLLIITTFFSVAISFYFSYMSAIFVLIYIVIKYFYSEEKTLKNFVFKIWNYAKYAIIGGVFLGGFAMLPYYYALANTSKSDGGVDFILPTIKGLFRAPLSIATVTDIYSNNTILGLCGFVVAMIPLLLVKKKKTPIMWMSIVGMIVAVVPLFEKVLNGLSYPSGRFAYCACFFIVAAAIELYDREKKEISKHSQLIMGTLAVVAIIGCIAKTVLGVVDSRDMIIMFVNIAFAIMLVYAIETNKNSILKHIDKVVCFNIVLIVMIYFSPFTGVVMEEYTDQGTNYKQFQSSSLKAAKHIDDNEFYRVNTYWNPWSMGTNSPKLHVPVNTNIYWGVPTTFEYLSTLDNNWLEYNKMIGNNQGYFVRMASFSNDSRARSDFLFGVKYYLGENKKAKKDSYDYNGYKDYGFDKKVLEKSGVSVYQSNYDSSLGYVFDKVISEEEIMKLTDIEREQALMQALLVDEADIESVKDVSRTDASNVELEDNKKCEFDIAPSGIKIKNNEFIVKKSGQSINVTLKESIDKCEVYIKFKNLKRHLFSLEERNKISKNNKMESFKAKMNSLNGEYSSFGVDVSYAGVNGIVGKRFSNTAGKAQAVENLEDFTVNLGYVEKFNKTINISFDSIGSYTYDDFEIIAVPMEQYDKAAKKLELNRLNVTSHKRDTVEANVDAQNNGLLYLGVLYNDGWDIYVDGKKVKDIYRVNKAFMGVKIAKGHHNIVMKYHPIGFPYTIVMFIVGVISILVIVVLYNKKRSKRG